jgi:sugar diacid utilization regulator
MAAPTAASSAQVSEEQIEALMAGSRALGALIAESLASVETVVTMPQLRVLILASAAPLNVSAVAEDLGVHRNTVRNRLGQVERLVGISLDDPQARVNAWIALQASSRPDVDRPIRTRRA